MIFAIFWNFDPTQNDMFRVDCVGRILFAVCDKAGSIMDWIKKSGWFVIRGKGQQASWGFFGDFVSFWLDVVSWRVESSMELTWHVKIEVNRHKPTEKNNKSCI